MYYYFIRLVHYIILFCRTETEFFVCQTKNFVPLLKYIYINQRRPQTDRRIVNCTRLIFCVPRSIIHIHIYIRPGNASARAPFKLINCVLDSNELPFSDGGEGDQGEVTSRLCKSAAAGSQEKSLRAYIIKKATS